MAVEDELRGGAIPDIKPRILTDQVCACVYIFYHPYLPNQSCLKTACISLTSHLKSAQEESLRLSCTSPVPIFQNYTLMSLTSEITFHTSQPLRDNENSVVPKNPEMAGV